MWKCNKKEGTKRGGVIDEMPEKFKVSSIFNAIVQVNNIKFRYTEKKTSITVQIWAYENKVRTGRTKENPHRLTDTGRHPKKKKKGQEIQRRYRCKTRFKVRKFEVDLKQLAVLKQLETVEFHCSN